MWNLYYIILVNRLGTYDYAECSRKTSWFGSVFPSWNKAEAGDNFFWGGSGERILSGYKPGAVVN